jgi:hypothetical protein
VFTVRAVFATLLGWKGFVNDPPREVLEGGHNDLLLRKSGNEERDESILSFMLSSA